MPLSTRLVGRSVKQMFEMRKVAFLHSRHLSVKRRKCISPIAVEESIYVYAVEGDIWMQITGGENVDVEMVYRVMR